MSPLRLFQPRLFWHSKAAEGVTFRNIQADLACTRRPRAMYVNASAKVELASCGGWLSLSFSRSCGYRYSSSGSSSNDGSSRGGFHAWGSPKFDRAVALVMAATVCVALSLLPCVPHTLMYFHEYMFTHIACPGHLTYTPTHLHTHTHTYVCVNIYMHTYIYTLTHAHKYVYLCICRCMYWCMYIHIDMHMYICVYVCMFIYV